MIALRADMDALPLPDTKDVPYRSTVDGVATPAGTTCTPRSCSGSGSRWPSWPRRGELPGRVRLIFQPAEETMPSGAPEVIAAGGLKDVAAIFALHCDAAAAGGPGRRTVRPVHRGRRHGRGPAHRAAAGTPPGRT